MKKILLFLILVLLFFIKDVSSQVSQRDKIYLVNGEVIYTQIVRVTNRKIFYLDPETYEIIDIKRDKVFNHEFNNIFFRTNVNGIMQHEEIYEVLDYSRKEIYEGIKLWMKSNSEGFDNFWYEDGYNFIIWGTYESSDFLTASAFRLLLYALNDKEGRKDIDIDFRIHFNVKIHIKDEKFKVCFDEFYVKYNDEIKTLKEIFGHRKTSMGDRTGTFYEMVNIVNDLKYQIIEMKSNVYLIKERDQIFEEVVRELLKENDW